jgi:GT2 family glycosyltransferase
MLTDVSIVIPSFRRKKSLIRLLQNIARVLRFSGNIYIIEQGETNESALRDIAVTLGLRVTYIYLDTPSTARAMNIGVQKAKSKYILFLDDDVLVHKGLIRAHMQNFSDPQVAATVGRCLTEGQHVQEGYGYTGRVNWIGQISEGFSSNIKQSVDTVIGCNTCWKKDVYDRLGGIDEQFTGNAMRLETDLSLRAKSKGHTIIFEPGAVISHLREVSGGARKTEGRIQWYFDFFSNETYFFLKHRHMTLLPLFLSMKLDWAVRCMFGFGREVSMRSIVTPWQGIRDGVKKYYTYIDEYRS